MNSSDYLLQLEKISKYFPGVQALDNVSFNISKGDVHAVIGENGAGKSTLMNIIYGVFPPDAGDIYLNGKKITFLDPHDALENGISMIFQEISLLQELSVAENIFVGRLPRNRLKFVNWKDLKSRSKNLLDQMEISIDPMVKVKDLSIGQQQMVEIVRAVSFNSRLVIMDEPTSSLSAHDSDLLFKVIKRLKDRGITVIYITHRLDELFGVVDKVTVLRDGKHIATLNIDKVDKEKLITLMAGRKVEEIESKRSYKQNIEIFKVINFNKSGFFSDISFSVNKGEILGIYGLIGAGRTELALSLIGEMQKDSGTIVLNDRKLKVNSTQQAIKYGISYLPEDRKKDSILSILSVKENITISSLRSIAKQKWFIDYRKENKVVTYFLKKLRIKVSSSSQIIMNLSGGNQQKVVLSRIMATNPKIMILDEPTRGIDVGAKIEVHSLIRELAENGLGIIIISSEMTELLAIADRIMVMKKGKIADIVPCEDADPELLLKLASV